MAIRIITQNCPDALITNSGSTYSATVVGGGALQLPNITITNSTGDTITTIPSVVDYVIPDVNWTDSNLIPQTTEYGQPIVCTPIAIESVFLNVSDTTPDYGDSITLTATSTNFTPTSYTFYVPITFGGYSAVTQTSSTYTWNVNFIGTGSTFVTATDNSNIISSSATTIEVSGLPLDYIKSNISSALAFKPIISSFTGSIVNIRRSSDNSASDFTYAELLDGTALSFVGAGNIGYLTRIYDQSGNNRDIFQTTANYQGIIIESNDFVRDSAGNITYRNQNGIQAMKTYGHMKSSDNNLVMLGTEINAITSGPQGWLFTYAGNPAVGVYSANPAETTNATTNTGTPDYYGNSFVIPNQRGPLGVHILGNLAITSIFNGNYNNSSWRFNDNATILLYADTSSKFSFMITSNNFDDAERQLLEEKMNDLYGYY